MGKTTSKIFISFWYSLLIVVLVIFFTIFALCIKNDKNAKNEYICAEKSKFDNIFVNILYNENEYNLFDFTPNGLSNIQKNIIENKERIKVLDFALKNGFSKEESLKYAFPEIEPMIKHFKNRYCYNPIPAKIEVVPNSGKVKLIESKLGLSLDENQIYDMFFNKINDNLNCFNIDLRFFNTESDINKDYFDDKMHLMGSFKTNFRNSPEQRKTNIRQALKSLDGVIVESGKKLSFNKTTGDRSEINGYKKAKVIKNGTFYDEYGGGVCQVSSTLYNAALISNLEIVQVHPHSLPVSYVPLSFDAMVNSCGADLVIKNNTEFPIIIATSSRGDECLINIYGIRNIYNIKRVSEKIKEISGVEREYVKDYKRFGFDNSPVNKGEEIILSYGKPGVISSGRLEYYIGDVLVKTVDIRNDEYGKTKEVVLVG